MAKQTDTGPVRAELARVAAPDEVQTVYAFLDRAEPEIAKVLPEAVPFNRFRRSVLNEVGRDPHLLDCSPESLVGAGLLAAQLGLELGPLGLVYLVPEDGAVEFIIGYRGYLDLAYRSGHVKDIAAALVCEGDEFDYRKGSRPYLDHVPTPGGLPRPVVAAYAVARLRSGGSVFDVVYEPDWNKARKASPSGVKNAGPWLDHLGGMIRKTALQRLEPMLPKSPLLSAAVVYDGAVVRAYADVADNEAAL